MKPTLLTHEVLRRTLQEAWDAHREFQKVYLHEKRDEMWAGWYAGFIIGRLGDFIVPSRLAYLLEAVQAEDQNWTDAAATHILKQLDQNS